MLNSAGRSKIMWTSLPALIINIMIALDYLPEEIEPYSAQIGSAVSIGSLALIAIFRKWFTGATE